MDEKVPRAWVVLTNTGKKLGAAAVIKELETWHQQNLSKYKWLRGGIEIVEEVGVLNLSASPMVLIYFCVKDSKIPHWEDTSEITTGKL